jgi:hypothetical protein
MQALLHQVVEPRLQDKGARHRLGGLWETNNARKYGPYPRNVG